MALEWTDIVPRQTIASADINALAHAIQADETDIAGKQDTLVSGTNIKTINGESILGDGNIDIQGGGGDVSTITLAGDTDVTIQPSSGDIEIATEGTYNASTNPLVTKGEVDKKQNIMQFASTDAVTNPQDGQIIQVTQRSIAGRFFKYDAEDVVWDELQMNDIPEAEEIRYNNETPAQSGLSATNVQQAIDELANEKQDKGEWHLLEKAEVTEADASIDSIAVDIGNSFFTNYNKFKIVLDAVPKSSYTATKQNIYISFRKLIYSNDYRVYTGNSEELTRNDATEHFKCTFIVEKYEGSTADTYTTMLPMPKAVSNACAQSAPLMGARNNGIFANSTTAADMRYVTADLRGYNFTTGTKLSFYAWEE